MKDYIQFITLLVNETAFDYYKKKNSCIASSFCLSYVLSELGFTAHPIKASTFIWPKSKNGHGCSLGREAGEGSGRAAKPGMWNGHLSVLVGGKWIADPTLDQCKNRFMNPEPIVFELQSPEHTNIEFGDCQGWYKIDKRQIGFKYARAARKYQWMPVAEMVLDIIKEHDAFPPLNPQQVESL